MHRNESLMRSYQVYAPHDVPYGPGTALGWVEEVQDVIYMYYTVP